MRTIEGKVIEGFKIGRTLGFPTANILADYEEEAFSQKGVYAVYVDIPSKNIFSLKGILNIGSRPSFSIDHPSIEVHIIDFNQEIYGETLRIKMFKKLREQQKFESKEALAMQLAKDKEIALSILD